MICNRCLTDKPEDSFYAKDKSCKECRKELVRQNRAKNIDHYRAYDAHRFQNDPRVRARHERYFSTTEGKLAQNAAAKRFIVRNPEKRAAHVAVGNAVRSGKLIKPSSCPKCGKSNVRIHGHHADYSKHLEVEWMCAKCHTALHKALL